MLRLVKGPLSGSVQAGPLTIEWSDEPLYGDPPEGPCCLRCGRASAVVVGERHDGLPMYGCRFCLTGLWPVHLSLADRRSAVRSLRPSA